jgi:DNA (cytosine-5)-methyltransferase 1
VTRKILVADLLCGAGGSSTGCERALAALGLKMELVCVNHWATAIETHTKNHPDARHYVQDIATVRPHLLVPEGYLDLLMASPTCTHHSVARGGKPTSDQQRSDPWHIVTWLTELRVKRVIIENVWEFCGWGPVDPRSSKPIAARKGEYFRAWIETIRRLGYEPEWKKLNAADYGDATTRQRFILMARNDGRRVVWPVATHQKKPEDGLALFPTVKPWRPAREIIDWSLRGRSIFNRKKPLAPKTLARIHAGAVKFHWPEPFLVILRNHMAGQSVDQPVPTIAANGNHIGLAEPMILNRHGDNGGVRTHSIREPLPTSDCRGAGYLLEPFVLSQQNSGAPRGVDDEPLPTITTGGASDANHAGCARRALIEPFVLTNTSGHAPHSTDDPLATATTGNHHAVVEPFILSRHAEGAPRSVDEPTPTQVAKHSHVMIASYYGASTSCSSDKDPLPTVTTKDRFGIVVPVTHAGGEDRARDVNEPLQTITCANRGELAFITAQHGEREGQVPRVHSVDDPSPAILATCHVDLIEGTPHYDILFRMLEPHELAAAMGFTTEDAAYEFAGTKTEQIKQIGNAVSVRKMAACVGAIMGDAAPRVKARVERPAAPVSAVAA